jgi:hypothetical protein
VVGLFQSAVIFDFLMDLYKLGFKLKLNNTSIRRYHYISSKSFLNNPLLLTLDNIFIWHRILLKIPLPLIYRPWVRVSVTLRVV